MIVLGKTISPHVLVVIGACLAAALCFGAVVMEAIREGR